MTPPVPHLVQRRLRILALFTGFLLFVWLPFEDTHINWVLLFAVLICSQAAARVIYGLRSKQGWAWLIYPLTGGLTGLAVTLVALLLMAFKSGVHGHEVPDFTPAQVTSVLARTPVWATAGLLIGLGTALWQKTR